MTAKKRPSKIRQKINELHEELEYNSLSQNKDRARSCTVGNCTGGLIEISMRGDAASLWYILHPVEAIEFMEQLASACGVEILKRPKQDFTSWRSWDLDQPNSAHWKGSAPWQISDKDKKQLAKVHDEKYGVLPANTNSVERPRLEASTRRKKKVEEFDEE